MTADTIAPAVPSDFPADLAPLLQAGLDQLNAEQREEERQCAAKRVAAEQALLDHWQVLVTVARTNLGEALAGWACWTMPPDWTQRCSEHTVRVQLPGCVPLDAYFRVCGDQRFAKWDRVPWPNCGLWRLCTAAPCEARLVYTDDLSRALALARRYQLQAEGARNEEDADIPF